MRREIRSDFAGEASVDRILTFASPEGKEIFGVETTPRYAPATCDAIVLPPGGYNISSGHNRIAADITRSLGVRQVRTLRFDYFGIGESDGYAEAFDPTHPRTAETRALLNGWRRDASHSQPLFAIGLCYGARVALRLAAMVQFTGIVLVVPAVGLGIDVGGERDHFVTEVQIATRRGIRLALVRGANDSRESDDAIANRHVVAGELGSFRDRRARDSTVEVVARQVLRWREDTEHSVNASQEHLDP